jgi:hypothetical protein
MGAAFVVKNNLDMQRSPVGAASVAKKYLHPFTTDMAPIGDRCICRLFFTTNAAPTGDRTLWKHLHTTDAAPIGDHRVCCAHIS